MSAITANQAVLSTALVQRTKWRVKQGGLHEGELVVLREEGVPPLKWRMGRIQRLFTGPDGIQRVADVKTSKGVVRRAIHKLCCLPGSTTGAASPPTRAPSVVEGEQDVKNLLSALAKPICQMTQLF
ncbi:unnamed protein product, partial [Iphiclides podalirius]